MTEIITHINGRPPVACIFFNAATGLPRVDLTVNVTLHDIDGTVIGSPTLASVVGDMYMVTPAVNVLDAVGLYDHEFVPTNVVNVSPVDRHVIVRVESAGALDAGAIWDELYAGHLDVGSFGEAVQEILSGVNSLGAATVVVASQIDPETLALELIRGDSYTVAAGRTLPPWQGEWWPNLSGRTVTFHARKDYDVIITQVVDVIQVTGPGQVRLQLTTAQTELLEMGGNGYRYDIEVAIGTEKITLARGALVVVGDVSEG